MKISFPNEAIQLSAIIAERFWKEEASWTTQENALFHYHRRILWLLEHNLFPTHWYLLRKLYIILHPINLYLLY